MFPASERAAGNKLTTFQARADAAHTLATVQAARLRLKIDSATPVPAPLQAFIDSVTAQSPFVDEDRALESELRGLTARIAACDLLDDYRGGPQA